MDHEQFERLCEALERIGSKLFAIENILEHMAEEQTKTDKNAGVESAIRDLIFCIETNLNN
jgi:hypothetical protein